MMGSTIVRKHELCRVGAPGSDGSLIIVYIPLEPSPTVGRASYVSVILDFLHKINNPEEHVNQIS
jgi:hypothetical protein